MLSWRPWCWMLVPVSWLHSLSCGREPNSSCILVCLLCSSQCSAQASLQLGTWRHAIGQAWHQKEYCGSLILQRQLL